MTTLTLPQGFRASGVAAGIKKNGKADLAIISSDTDCAAAAVFTTNKVKAAPVLRGMQQIGAGRPIRAVVINAGCANACTGRQGMLNASETANGVAKALHIKANNVFVMSTGVIGVQLPMDKLHAGVPQAVAALAEDGFGAAANAIMTTDTVPKTATAEVSHGDKTVRFAGMAKGAGMIHPNMATLLSVVMTDAIVDARVLRMALKQATQKSFNRISIDGDTSTNDTLLVLANGASGVKLSAKELSTALTNISIDLAKQVARDGEGATKFITIEVTGAKTERMAETIGRTIAKSPLVKTAFYGEDANWGRIVCAAGYSGEDVIPEKLSLWFSGVHVFAKGTPTNYSEQAATEAMKLHDVAIRLDLGLGAAAATVWTCDFSHEYVTVNGKYRT